MDLVSGTSWQKEGVNGKLGDRKRLTFRAPDLFENNKS